MTQRATHVLVSRKKTKESLFSNDCSNLPLAGEVRHRGLVGIGNLTPARIGRIDVDTQVFLRDPSLCWAPLWLRACITAVFHRSLHTGLAADLGVGPQGLPEIFKDKEEVPAHKFDKLAQNQERQ